MKISTLKIALFFIICLSALMMMFGFLTYKNTLIALGAWNDSNKMLVFLKIDTTIEQKNKVIESLKNKFDILSVEVVDRKTAGLSFQKSLKDYANGLVTTDELIDLIPETLEVDLQANLSLSERQKNFDKIAQELKLNENVEDVSYSANWLDKFEKIDKFIRTVGIFFFSVILLLMSYLVSLMMRVYIDDSKTEIEVYNLLGATRWSIYKLFVNDLVWFMLTSYSVAIVFGLIIFRYLKDLIVDAGLSNLIVQNFVFLSLSELLLFAVGLFLIVFIHSFFTISSSVNKLNQITNG